MSEDMFLAFRSSLKSASPNVYSNTSAGKKRRSLDPFRYSAYCLASSALTNVALLGGSLPVDCGLLLLRCGGSIFDERGRAVLDSDGVHAALDYRENVSASLAPDINRKLAMSSPSSLFISVIVKRFVSGKPF